MLDRLLNDFNENLIGLREFVELIDPFLDEKIKEDNKFVQPLLLSAMFKDILSKKDSWKDGEKEKLLEAQKTLSEELKQYYNILPEVYIDKDSESEEGDSKEKGAKVIKFRTSDPEVGNRIDSVKKSLKHKELLFTNSLISLLSFVEWYFSQILHYYYDKFPESAGIHKRTLTLSELKSFTSIDDAEKYLIDIKIDEILRGSFESWVSLLKSELSLGLGYLEKMFDELVEIYQRRNLFVHNGGVVNSIYLSKVKEEYKTDIGNGDKLIVDKNYLDKAICKLQKAFILIGSELWKKIGPIDNKRSDVLIDIIYENLLHSRWDICEGLCLFLLKDSNTSPVNKVLAQLNYWLTQKELGRIEQIKEELYNTDYSDKKEIFQLGLFALQEETEKFFEILPVALDTGQINIERLEEFPILNNIRQTEEYKRFKEETKYFKEPNKEVIKTKSVQKEESSSEISTSSKIN